MRFYVTNKLPEHTTIHWHGLILPSGMDGVGGLSHPGIPPGKTFVYEFDLTKSGTFMYHPHADEMVQMAMGMMGMQNGIMGMQNGAMEMQNGALGIQNGAMAKQTEVRM